MLYEDNLNLDKDNLIKIIHYNTSNIEKEKSILKADSNKIALNSISLDKPNDMLKQVLSHLNLDLCDLFNIFNILIKDLHKICSKNFEDIDKNSFIEITILIKAVIGKIIGEFVNWKDEKDDFLKKYQIHNIYKIDTMEYSYEKIKLLCKTTKFILNRFLYLEILINQINNTNDKDIKYNLNQVYMKLVYYERYYCRSYINQNSNIVKYIDNIEEIKNGYNYIWIQRYYFNNISEKILEIVKNRGDLQFDKKKLKILNYKLFNIEYILNSSFLEISQIKKLIKEKQRLQRLYKTYEKLITLLSNLSIINNKYIYYNTSKNFPTSLYQILGLIYEKYLIERYNKYDNKNLTSNSKIYIDYNKFGILCNVDCINNDTKEYIELKLRMNDSIYFKNKRDLIYNSKKQLLKYGCQISTLLGAGLDSKLLLQYYLLSTNNINEAKLQNEDITNIVVSEIKPLMQQLLKSNEDNINILCNNFTNFVNEYVFNFISDKEKSL